MGWTAQTQCVACTPALLHPVPAAKGHDSKGAHKRLGKQTLQQQRLQHGRTCGM